MNLTETIIAALALALVGTGAAAFVRSWMQYRGKRIVICPETNEPAGVEVDSLLAAGMTAWRGEPGLRLRTCSRWPERAGCPENCVDEIVAGPEETKVDNVVHEYYEDKACTLCGRPVLAGRWHEAGLLTPEGGILAWREMRPEELPAALQDHRPLCANCEEAEEFRRLYPELVTDRRETPLRDQMYH